MERLLIYLTAIAGLSKDIHYGSYGDYFYPDHLLMDRIYDGLYDLVDEIQEKYFMYNNLEAISSKKIFETASSMLNDDLTIEEKMVMLRNLMKDAIYIADDTSKKTVYDCGDNDLLGRIASKLKTDVGLLNRTLEQQR